jgi:hemerythrin
MTLIEWKEEFKTGIEAVDYEHETLVALLNELYANLGADASHDQIQDFLGEVHARIAAHFALEEKMMREVGYDQYVEHKTDHDRLLDEIRDIMDRHAEHDYEGYDDRLATHLRHWFVEHFKTRDARLHGLVG